MKRDRFSLIVVAIIIIAGVAAMVYLQDGDTPEKLDPLDVESVEDSGTGITRSAKKFKDDGPETVDSTGAGEETPVAATPEPKADCAHVVGRVIDKAKNPIQGAVVALCLDISDFRSRGRVGQVIDHVVTDAEGLFSLLDVHVGEIYSLRAESQGFASKYVTGLQLEAGSSKVFEVIMHEGITIKGLVTDLGDQPVAGARVFVQDLGMQVTDKLGGVERETVSGADGRFVIANLNQGFKNFGASKPSYATKQLYNFHVHFSQSKRDVVLKLGPGDGLKGRVVDGQDVGIGGVEVTAQPLQMRGDRFERNFQTVRSDKDGQFIFDGLKKGDYHLTCKKLGYYSAHPRNLAKTSGPDAVIRLKQNPVIRGRVVDEETHQPVTSFTLYSTPRKSLLFVSNNAKQHFESEDGTFAFRCLRNKGDVFLHLEAQDYASGESKKIVLSQQESVEGVVVKALKGAVAVGRVLDADGKAIAGAEVEMETIPDGSEGLGRLGAMVYGKLALLLRKVRTDAEGRFRISRLRPANYRIHVKHGAHATRRGGRLHKVERSGDFPVGDIILLKGGTLSGIVYGGDNSILPNVLVKLLSEDAIQTGGFDIETKTDSKGFFQLRHLSAGGYKLQVIRTARLAQIVGQFPNLPSAKYISVFIGEGEEKEIEVRGL